MIRLRFVREPCLASDAIAWFTQGHFSHVGCLLADGSELGSRSDRVGAKPAGVEIRPGNYATFALVAVFEIDTAPAREKAFHAFLRAQIGKPYDRSAIWGFVFARDWREPDAWICSELMAAGLEAAGIVRPLCNPSWKITPDSLALVASAIGARVARQETGRRTIPQPGEKECLFLPSQRTSSPASSATSPPSAAAG